MKKYTINDIIYTKNVVLFHNKEDMVKVLKQIEEYGYRGLNGARLSEREHLVWKHSSGKTMKNVLSMYCNFINILDPEDLIGEDRIIDAKNFTPVFSSERLEEETESRKMKWFNKDEALPRHGEIIFTYNKKFSTYEKCIFLGENDIIPLEKANFNFCTSWNSSDSIDITHWCVLDCYGKPTQEEIEEEEMRKFNEAKGNRYD